MATKALSELLAAVEQGTLDNSAAERLQGQGADLKQALRAAVHRNQTAAVLLLAKELEVRLDHPSGDAEGAPTADDMLSQASAGNWGWVAYFAVAAGEAPLLKRLSSKDSRACRDLQEMAGLVRVKVPRGLKQSYVKTGRLSPDHPDLYVEQKRWLLPRPQKEDCFTRLKLDTGRPEENIKLEEGWYTLVQYPLDDELREAVLRRKDWGVSREGMSREPAAAEFLQEPSCGERLLSKAFKAHQWDFIRWLLEDSGPLQPADVARLVQQAEEEFLNVWDEGPCASRRTQLRSRRELKELCGCLDEGGVLRSAWRQGHLKVPAGAALALPSREALHEALALEELWMEALRLVGALTITFCVPVLPEVKRRWVADLRALPCWPLLHQAIRGNAPKKLLELVLAQATNVDVLDFRGLNALVVAAEEGHWDAAEQLLKSGCSADGRSGDAASRAARELYNSADPRVTDEQKEQASSLLVTIDEYSARPPCRSLSDFFLRQAKFGQLVHGMQPRRFKLIEGQLCLLGGAPRIFARAMVFNKEAEFHEVRFAVVSQSAYDEAVDAAMLDLAAAVLLREEALVPGSHSLLIPVLLPPEYLHPAADGKEKAAPPGASRDPFAMLSMPLLAFAPPMGILRVESVASCCKVAIGRVEVVVEDMRLDETPKESGMGMPGEDSTSAVEVLVPLKRLKVMAQFSGREVVTEELQVVANDDSEYKHLQVCGECIGDDALLTGGRKICRCEVGENENCGILVEVSVAVYVYIQMNDEEEQVEFVYVAGHKGDVPEDSRPFVGIVEWDGGSKRIDEQTRYVVIGADECLHRLMSLRLKPELPAGRKFEMALESPWWFCTARSCTLWTWPTRARPAPLADPPLRGGLEQDS